MFGTGGNEDVNAGAFFLPACPGYLHHIGGGKPPPPTLPPMIHAGDLAYNKQGAPFHRPVRQRREKESRKAGGGGTTVEFREGLPGLQVTVGDSNIVQISVKVADRRELQFVGSDRMFPAT